MYVDIRDFGDRYRHVTQEVLFEWSRTKWYNSLRARSLPRLTYPLDFLSPDGTCYRLQFHLTATLGKRDLQGVKILVRVELTLWDLM
jgi:hypothetical protein